MPLSIVDFVGWTACSQQFLWTFGGLTVLVMTAATIAWWREDTDGFEPWHFCGLITMVLGLVYSFLAFILSSERWWLRLLAWIGVSTMLLFFLDRLLPSLFGTFATLGVGFGLQYLLDTDRFSKRPPTP